MPPRRVPLSDTLTFAELRAQLADVLASERAALPWRERLWLVPADTRLTLDEVAAALDRSRSWIYQRLDARFGNGVIPHRMAVDGAERVFVAGELRGWIQQQEVIVQSGPTDADARRAG